jgi:hypothetical protein
MKTLLKDTTAMVSGAGAGDIVGAVIAEKVVEYALDKGTEMAKDAIKEGHARDDKKRKEEQATALLVSC